eukprot:7384061-Prymnesium_polylepis.1
MPTVNYVRETDGARDNGREHAWTQISGSRAALRPRGRVACVTARRVITVALLTGGCAALGVGVRARESLPTGVNASS